MRPTCSDDIVPVHHLLCSIHYSFRGFLEHTAAFILKTYASLNRVLFNANQYVNFDVQMKLCQYLFNGTIKTMRFTSVI